MSFKNLLLNYSKLIKHMEDDGYSKSYILLLKTEINWLQKNGGLAGTNLNFGIFCDTPMQPC